MAAKKNLRKLVDEVAVLLQKLVRLKAADANGYVSCVTCGVRKHWKEADGAHYISRTHQGTKIVEENIHPSCKRCNMLDDIFVREAYTEYMIDMYGQEFVDELKILARTPIKHDRGEMEDLKKQHAKQIKEMEDG